MKYDIKHLREAAVEFARAGGDSTLKHFKKSFDLEFKSDQSPVTNADREAERIIRDLIRDHFPGHGIIGEEYGEENINSEVIWILDPIDGTRSFIHGVPFYTTLIGVMIRQKPSVGVIYAPALDEMVSAATDQGCTMNGENISVRKCNKLENATFLTTDVDSFGEFGYDKVLQKLIDKTRIHRTWGDAYGHMMVAAGRADIMIDAVLNLWDAAALLPVITEAGGVYCDLSGVSSIQSGNALSTNQTLKEEIVQLFKNNNV